MAAIPITFSYNNTKWGIPRTTRDPKYAKEPENEKPVIHDTDDIRDKNCICLTFPKSCLEERASTFTFKKDPTSQSYFRTAHFMLNVSFEQDNIYKSSRIVPGATSEQNLRPQLVFLVEQLEENVPALDPTTAFKNAKVDAAGKEERMKDDPNSKKAKKQIRIPKIIGYRFWMFFDELDDRGALSEYLESYLILQDQQQLQEMQSRTKDAINAAMGEKVKTKGKHRLPPRMTTASDWINCLNHIYAGRGDVGRAANIFNQQSFGGTVADPLKALSKKRMFAHTKNFEGVNPVQLDISQYTTKLDKDGRHSFPCPDRVFRYTQDQIRKFWHYQIPDTIEYTERYVKMRDDLHSMRSLEEMKQMGVVKENAEGVLVFDQADYDRFWKNAGFEDDDYQIKYNEVDKGLEEHFKTTIGSFSQAVPDRYDPDFYAQQSVKERKRVLENWKAKSKSAEGKDWSEEEAQNELATMLDEYRETMANQFARLCQPDFPFISPYMRHAVEFFNKFKEKNSGSACMRFRKRSNNVSLWEDFLTTMIREMELMFDVTNAHFKALVCWFAAMNMSDHIRSNKIIVVNYGAAKTSKSFVTELVESMCIEGTVITVSYQTLRSETAEGNHDGHLSIFNETPEGMMGVNKEKIHGKDSMLSANVNMEAMNQFKEKTTRGKVVVRTLVIDKDTGDRIEKIIESYRNSSYIFNTNANPFKWEAAVLSRCVLQAFSDQIREGSRPTEKNWRNMSPKAKEIQEKTREKYKWIHMHIRYLDEAMEKKKICAINTEFSRTMLRDILKKAEELGVPETDCPRKMSTIMAAVRIGIKVRGILLAFGCQLNQTNPNGTQPYDFPDTIMLDGFMVDTDPSILVSILGVFKFIYEDPLRFYVIRALTLKYVLKENRIVDGQLVSNVKDAAPGPTEGASPTPQGPGPQAQKKAFASAAPPSKFATYSAEVEDEMAEAVDQAELLHDQRVIDRIKSQLADSAQAREKKIERNKGTMEAIQKKIDRQLAKLTGAEPPNPGKKQKKRDSVRDSSLDLVPRDMEDEGEDVYREEEDAVAAAMNLSDDESTRRGQELEDTDGPIVPVNLGAIADSLHPSKKQGKSVHFDMTAAEIREKEKELLNRTDAKAKLMAETQKKKEWKLKEKEEKERKQMASSYTDQDWADDKKFWSVARMDVVDDPNIAWPTNKNFIHIRLPNCHPSKKTNYYYRPLTIYNIARDICTIIPTRPTAEHVEEVLTQLCNMPLKLVTVDLKTSKRTVDYTRAILFEEPWMAIHKDLLKHNSKSRLEQAVKEVVGDFLKEDQTFVFGQKTDSIHPDEFHMIHVVSKDKRRMNADPFILQNQEYVSSVVRDFNRVNLDEAFAELDSMERMHFEEFSLAKLQIERAKVKDTIDKQKLKNAASRSVATALIRKKNKEGQKAQDAKSALRPLHVSDDPEVEVSLQDDIMEIMRSLETQDKALEKQIEEAQEKTRLSKAEDVTYPANFHVDYNYATGIWQRHMVDNGWNKAMIEQHNCWPESKIHKMLIAKYEATNMAAAKKGLPPPLPPLRPYPDNMGFEDRTKLHQQDVEKIVAYASDHGGEADPCYSYLWKIRPFGRKLGLSDAEFLSLENGDINDAETMQLALLATLEIDEHQKSNIKKKKQKEVDFENSVYRRQEAAHDVVHDLIKGSTKGIEGQAAPPPDFFENLGNPAIPMSANSQGGEEGDDRDEGDDESRGARSSRSDEEDEAKGESEMESAPASPLLSSSVPGSPVPSFSQRTHYKRKTSDVSSKDVHLVEARTASTSLNKRGKYVVNRRRHDD